MREAIYFMLALGFLLCSLWYTNKRVEELERRIDTPATFVLHTDKNGNARLCRMGSGEKDVSVSDVRVLLAPVPSTWPRIYGNKLINTPVNGSQDHN